MKITLTAVYTSFVFVLTIPKMVQALQLQHLYEVSLPSFVNAAKTESTVADASKSIIGHRSLQILTEECKNESIKTLLADSVYNNTKDANQYSCPTAPLAWLDPSGLVYNVMDYRDCDQSKLKAYCEENYQWIQIPDHKIFCPANGEDPPFDLEAYFYDEVFCMAKGESCPSDSVGMTKEDFFFRFLGSTDYSQCTIEFLEEGHQPPQEPEPEELEYDNVSQECLDEIDILYNDVDLQNASQAFNEECSCNDPAFSGNDTIFVLDHAACDKELISEYRATLKDLDVQPMEFTNWKATCPGNILAYVKSLWDYVGPSCPSNSADYTARDIHAIFVGFDHCTFERIEDGDVPPTPCDDVDVLVDGGDIDVEMNGEGDDKSSTTAATMSSSLFAAIAAAVVALLL